MPKNKEFNNCIHCFHEIGDYTVIEKGKGEMTIA
jgi:hypothetical protein